MIRSVHVRGFQSLDDVQLDLGRLTVISGPSGSGKSALVRAFRAALANTRGTFFVRDGAFSAQVSLTLLEGVGATVDPIPWTLEYAKRVSGKSGSTVYTISGEEHTAVGSGPVEAVLEETRIEPDLQVVDQFAPPYLLSATPSEAARSLGALTRSDVIQAAVAKAAGHQRKFTSEETTLASLTAAAERTFDAFAWYPDFAIRVVALGPLARRVQALSTRLHALSDLAGRLQASLALEARTRARVAPLAAALPDLSEQHQGVWNLEQRIREATEAARQINLVSKSIRGHLSKRQATVDLMAEFGAELERVVSEVDVCPVCLVPASDPSSHLHEQLAAGAEPAATGRGV